MEIRFKRDTAFRKTFFVPDSFAHPAKMDAQLLIWIVAHYTQVGETILDPMAGSGTLMLACTLGRDVVLVELEEKFCKMMRDNWNEVKMRPQLGYQMGSCEIICGDARQLEGLCDKIITSPPYAESDVSQTHMTSDKRGDKSNPNYRPSWKRKIDEGYCETKRPYVDKIVTSPPYAESTHHSDDPQVQEKFRPGRTGTCAGTAGENPDNLGNLPYGQIDATIFSPPYENAIHKGSAVPGEEGNVVVGDDYVKSASNIGNLKSQSYLQAMLQVYQQCFSVLKNGGLMILVVKPFIRDQKLVPLQVDTKRLCEQVGFSFLEEHHRILPSQSFWRVIYAKKYPDAPKIDREYVLVFRK